METKEPHLLRMQKSQTHAIYLLTQNSLEGLCLLKKKKKKDHIKCKQTISISRINTIAKTHIFSLGLGDLSRETDANSSQLKCAQAPLLIPLKGLMTWCSRPDSFSWEVRGQGSECAWVSLVPFPERRTGGVRGSCGCWLTMDLVKGLAKVKSSVYAHQPRWREEYIIFPGCTAFDVTPRGDRRRWSSLEKRMLHSLDRL